MRTIITGATGQLGQALQKVLTGQNFEVLDVPRMDVKDHAIVETLAAYQPELVIHAAAMSDVNGCARDPDAAFSINAFGTQNVAHACLQVNAKMLYISTNEVFDGRSGQPYTEDAQPHPINPYGSSKRAGEQMAAHYLKTGLYIVRTAWLYGGGHKFPEKIITAANKQGELKVVTDEISNPTYTLDLAAAIAHLVTTQAYGIYHFTNAGYCSRYDFAREILKLSGRENIPLQPIYLTDFVRPSAVPPFTPLANVKGPELGIEFRSWQEALKDYFETGETG